MIIASNTPTILAIEMWMVKPKVSTNIPRSKTIGLVRPKLCPYANQLSPDTSAAKFPISPPKTIPDNSNRNNAQLFFPLIPLAMSLFPQVAFFDSVFFLKIIY